MQVPAPFEYERATSVDHAIGLLDRLGDSARLVAGGHSLLPMMKLRLANFEYLIDINELHSELGYITVETDQIRIGAMTRHRELLESADLARAFPIFADAERVIADPVVRNRGTLGGSLCQADPSEDLSAVCTTLGASCVIRSTRRRTRRLDGGLPPRPVRDRGRRRRDARRGPVPGAAERFECLREGRAARRRLGRGVRRRGGLAGRRGHRRCPGRAGCRRTEHHRHPGDLRRPARQRSVRAAVRAGGRDRGAQRAIRPPTCAAARSTSDTSPTS